MKDLNGEFKFLKKVIPRLRKIRYMEGICCITVRDMQLNIAIDRLLEHLEIPIPHKKNSLTKYNELRDIILKSNQLDTDKKLELHQLF